MTEPKSFFVISRFNEDISWLDSYTSKYLVYNKGNFISEDNRIIPAKNLGGNQRDEFQFIVNCYECLPPLTAFIQADPFPHCKKEIFDKLIYNDSFTQLEYYGMVPANGCEGRTIDGKFLEANVSWYIPAHNATHNQTCRYSSFDQFMNHYFENYVHLDWLQFSPGSQYIVPKANILYYPKDFWESLMNELNSLTPTEGHIIERALYYIFTNAYKLKELY